MHFKNLLWQNHVPSLVHNSHRAIDDYLHFKKADLLSCLQGNPLMGITLIGMCIG